ncbi:hypothetical protein [Lucifera butyrica]|nr:hypothetical protein [Lucifera butyrica]
MGLRAGAYDCQVAIEFINYTWHFLLCSQPAVGRDKSMILV